MPDTHPDPYGTIGNRTRYAISKQLPSMIAIDTDYGQIILDEEMKQAVDAALRPILKRILKWAEAEGGSGHDL